MKIALLYPGCHRRGGVERIMRECALFLASRDYDVHVFANEWDDDLSACLHFHRVPIRKIPKFAAPRSYHRNAIALLKPAEYDAIGTFGCECPLGGVLWVQSVHKAWLERSKAFRPPTSAARIRQRLNPLHPVLLGLEYKHFGRRTYRKVVATTPHVRNDLRRLYDVPAQDVEIIPNGFAPTEFNPQRRHERRAEMRSRLNLAPDDVALLFVANELDRKGYPTILDALRRLNQPRVKLLVVGRPDVRDVRARAATARIANQVIACGSTDDVASFHAASDLFVLPTQYEAFCLAILEALGSGLPVITSDVPGARDAIEPGVNGAIIHDPQSGSELAEALEPMLEKSVREKLSASAPQTVSQYRWPVVLERYERVLQDHPTR